MGTVAPPVVRQDEVLAPRPTAQQPQGQEQMPAPEIEADVADTETDAPKSTEAPPVITSTTTVATPPLEGATVAPPVVRQDDVLAPRPTAQQPQGQERKPVQGQVEQVPDDSYLLNRQRFRGCKHRNVQKTG